ncbi:MAG: ATP synthase F1 subunit gamma [Dissulfurispiraceae bacterium]|jgi:F-type H+-transporting ATPase subunit gamma|nr:ATP synthase F1 subunit gamma [Dissulfurispiraceae bacterium]
MPGLKEIRKKIGAVKSTRQITKAMKMVSAAKFRRSQGRMFELRPYADKMASVLADLSASVDKEHPLLQSRPRKKIELLVFTGDRGLCGAFNTNIMKAATKLLKEFSDEGLEVVVSTIGKKGTDLFRRRKADIRRSWTGLSGKITYANAQEIAQDFIENYTSEVFDEVIIIYNQFKSPVVQKVTTARLLPIAAINDDAAVSDHGPDSQNMPAEFEPSEQAVFDKLLPKNIEIQIYRALLESQASEEAARMAAMENATRNAEDLISQLTLQYNKARQAAITKELIDIVGGVEASK